MSIFRVLIACIFFFLVSCHYQPSGYSTNSTQVNDSILEDERIEDLIEPYKSGLDAEMNRQIGFFAHDMFKKNPESELGNFMCDASQEYYNALYSGENLVDFTIMNYGGIRVQSIPQGPVTVRHMFELMPFENELVVIETPGTIVKEVFEKIAEYRGWPVSKEINLLIENGKINTLLVNTELLDETKTYRLLTTDYVANGGNGMDMFEGLPMEQTGQKLRDVLIAYCEWKLDNSEKITARINGRIIVIEE